jgi:hypothetical protein
MRRLAAIGMAGLVGLSACSTTAPYRDQVKDLCAAGDASACNHLPDLDRAVANERAESAGDAVLTVLGGLLLLGAAAAEGFGSYEAATHPYVPPQTTVVVVCHWNC